MLDEFFLKHGGEIREALLMIEVMTAGSGCSPMVGRQLRRADGQQFALLHSCNTDRTHLLVSDRDGDPTHVCHWHRIDAAALRILQGRTPGCAPLAR